VIRRYTSRSACHLARFGSTVGKPRELRLDGAVLNYLPARGTISWRITSKAPAGRSTRDRLPTGMGSIWGQVTTLAAGPVVHLLRLFGRWILWASCLTAESLRQRGGSALPGPLSPRGTRLVRGWRHSQRMWSAIYARHPVMIADSSNDAAASIIVCHQYSAFGFIGRMMAWAMRPRQSVFRSATEAIRRWYHAKAARLPNAARPSAAASPMRAPEPGRHRARPTEARCVRRCGRADWPRRGGALCCRRSQAGRKSCRRTLSLRGVNVPSGTRQQESCEAWPGYQGASGKGRNEPERHRSGSQQMPHPHSARRRS
jgi:hypothetical protein